jgi:hypothetical protein
MLITGFFRRLYGHKPQQVVFADIHRKTKIQESQSCLMRLKWHYLCLTEGH